MSKQRRDISDYEKKAKIFKALSHPSRLIIVEALGHGELCVCELTKLVGADMSTVSKHLTLLRNSGIVERDKRGQQVYYRLKVPCILNFFHCIQSVLTAAPYL